MKKHAIPAPKNPSASPSNSSSSSSGSKGAGFTKEKVKPKYNSPNFFGSIISCKCGGKKPTRGKRWEIEGNYGN